MDQHTTLVLFHFLHLTKKIEDIKYNNLCFWTKPYFNLKMGQIVGNKFECGVASSFSQFHITKEKANAKWDTWIISHIVYIHAHGRYALHSYQLHYPQMAHEHLIEHLGARREELNVERGKATIHVVHKALVWRKVLGDAGMVVGARGPMWRTTMWRW